MKKTKQQLVHNPHDRFFRASLSDPRVAKDMLETYLPKHIQALVDLNTLCMRPGTFIDEELQLHLTDVLFSLDLKTGEPAYIYTLLEHQRTPDPLMPFRKLQYTVKIMAEHYKIHKILPIVYTTVIYNGEEKYTNSTDLFDLFDEAHRELAKETFLKPFDLIDLSQISDECLKAKVWSGMLTLSLKHISERDLVPFIQSVIGLMQAIEQEDGVEFLRTTFNYFFSVGEVQNIDHLMHTIHEHLSPTLEENIMTIAQQLRQQGIQIGIEQGKEKWVETGRNEAIQEFALQLLAKNFSTEDIISMTGLSAEIVQALRKKNITH